MKVQHALSALLLLLVAGTAWAITKQDLQDEADRLTIVFDDLEVAIDGCPGGTCGGAGQIESDLAVASGDLDQLIADRASLPGCTCTQVDADIAALKAARGTQEDIVDDWG